MSKISLVYYSATGNTEQTAKAIEEAGLRVDLKVSGSIAESLGNFIREENK